MPRDRIDVPRALRGAGFKKPGKDKLDREFVHRLAEVTRVAGMASADLVASIATRYDPQWRALVKQLTSEDEDYPSKDKAFAGVMQQVVGYGPKSEGQAMVAQMSLRIAHGVLRKMFGGRRPPMAVEQSVFLAVNATAETIYEDLRDAICNGEDIDVIAEVAKRAAISAHRRAQDGSRAASRNQRETEAWEEAKRVTSSGQDTDVEDVINHMDD